MAGLELQSTPMVPSSSILARSDSLFDGPGLYRSVIEALQHNTITRPETAVCVNKVCQYMHCGSLEDCYKMILRYLRGTLHHGLIIKESSDLTFTCYADAGWTSCLDDRISTTGFCFFILFLFLFFT